MVGVDGGDLDETPDPGKAGPLDRLQRPFEVDGALAFDVAVRAAAGGEHHGVAPVERGGEGGGVLLFDVEQAHLGAPVLEVVAVLLVADQRYGVDVRPAQVDQQVPGHLTVPPDDSGAHHAFTLLRAAMSLSAGLVRPHCSARAATLSGSLGCRGSRMLLRSRSMSRATATTVGATSR